MGIYGQKYNKNLFATAQTLTAGQTDKDVTGANQNVGNVLSAEQFVVECYCKGANAASAGNVTFKLVYYYFDGETRHTTPDKTIIVALSGTATVVKLEKIAEADAKHIVSVECVSITNADATYGVTDCQVKIAYKH